MLSADDFLKRLNKVESGCWEFTGAISHAGYGNLTINKKQHSSHVMAYKLFKGDVPKGMLVCHSCDNKICCNPNHLFLGTVQDNKDDEVAKGRHVKGSRQGHAKLKEEDVLTIKELLKKDYSCFEIAQIYNVSSTAIYYIRSGQNWGWLK